MKSFYISVLCIAIGVGWLCSQASNCSDNIEKEYTSQTSKIDKLITIFEDWKEKDTNR